MPPATESDDERLARRLRSVLLAVAAAVVVVVAVLAVLGAIDNNDADRRPQPVGAIDNNDADRRPQPVGTVPALGKKGVVSDVVTDVERGMRFGLLDGRVLTVELLPNGPNQTFETFSGARISATCGANVAASPGDPRRETTLTRRWPVFGPTSMSYRFPRDVSSWCRLKDQSGSIIASVRFPGVPPGASELINETAIKWARLIAASPQTCNDYMGKHVCEETKAFTPYWASTHRDATVQTIAISGDRAAAMLSNHQMVQLQRTATGEWLIDKLGPEGAVGPYN